MATMTVVGIFDDLNHAHAAVTELTAAGHDPGAISVIRGDGDRAAGHAPPSSPAAAAMAYRMDPDAAAARTGVTPDWGMASAGRADSAATLAAIDADPDAVRPAGVKLGAGTGALAGAGTGAVVGGSLGLLTGAAGLFIPGLGPILGMGPMLATILGGAGIGAVAGGLTGALVNAGVPEADAGFYAEGVRRGGTLVTVVADGQSAADVAADVMDRAGAYDVNERAATWAEATAPVGGNTEVSSLSTLPDSSMTADAPVARA
jgi:hypothetical protein